MRLSKQKAGSGAATGLGVVGAAATVKTMYDVFKEVSFDDIRDESSRPPRLLFLATTPEEAEQYARLLTGSEQLTGVGIGTLATDIWNANSYDAIVVHDPLNTGASARLRLESPNGLTPPKLVTSNLPFDQDEAKRVRQMLADALDERAVAFGRFYPHFRAPVISQIVTDTSTANAQFAFVANVPALIPVVGGFLSAGADMILLTKNQLMMVYKIAAASGRNLEDQQAIIREMIPVVGSGFLWRTAAREAASFLPIAAGTIPKVAIAFTGTYALGRAAELFYRFGTKPSPEQRREFYAQARDLVARLPFSKKEKIEAVEETIEAIEDEADIASASVGPVTVG